MNKSLVLILAVITLFSCSSKREYMVRMHTTAGVIDMKLYNETPAHRDNFVKLVKECYFDSLLFHRVIPDFMIQAGDPNSKNAPRGALLGDGGPDYTIEAEFMPEKHFHKRGALAAAREGDDVNPSKASAASQFYIVWGNIFTPEQLKRLVDGYKKATGREIVLSPEQEQVYTTVGGTPHLDGEYTVFGEVVSGLEVVDAIQRVRRDRNDRPLKDIRIIKTEIIKK